MENNTLSGTIPPLPSKLAIFKITNNNITGKVPSTICNLNNFDLTENPYLYCPLPSCCSNSTCGLFLHRCCNPNVCLNPPPLPPPSPSPSPSPFYSPSPSPSPTAEKVVHYSSFAIPVAMAVMVLMILLILLLTVQSGYHFSNRSPPHRQLHASATLLINEEEREETSEQLPLLPKVAIDQLYLREVMIDVFSK